MSKKRLNLHEQGYKAGDPMWVSWDKRWDGPMRRELMWEGVYQEERLVTTIGFFRYDNREFLALDRTKRPNGCEDIIYIPTPLVKEYGKFHAEQYSTFIRYIFVYNTLVSERLNVRIRRYAEATNYAKVLTGVYNGIPKGENGMNNVTLPEVTVTPRNINLAGAVDRGRREAAPYVSTLLTGAIFGPLSVAGGYAGNEAVNKITNVASNDKYKDWADMLSKTTGMNPVFTQTKVGPIEKENVLDELARIFESKGWTRINDSSYKNSKITVGDITTENVGMLNGKPVIFDPEAAYNKDIIRVSNAKFKNKNN